MEKKFTAPWEFGRTGLIFRFFFSVFLGQREAAIATVLTYNKLKFQLKVPKTD